MKLYLLTIFTFFTLFCHAQTMFGNQQILTIPTGTSTITASLYLPDDYFTTTQIYPIIVFVPGRGEWGTDPADCVKYGPSHFIYNGTWNGQSVNPKTGLIEKFIVVTLLSPRSGASLGICEVDKGIDYFYTNYRCDTNRLYNMGLSAGAGGPVIYYASFSAEDAFCGSYVQKHGPAAIVPMSAENTNNDPVTVLATNQTHVWGFGDTRDPHGLSTQLLVQHLNAASPGLGIFTPYVYNGNPCPGATCGHGGWLTYENPNYRENGLNIYEWCLQFSKNAAAPSNQIFTGTVSPLSYCVTASANATGTVSYSTSGTWTAGNKFVVQMSDIAGNFSNPVNLDSVTTTTGSGTITFHVPANTLPGLTYKLRVIARNPAIVGSNSAVFTVVLAKNSIAPTTTQNILVGGFGTPLTGTEASTPISRQWYDGSTLISGSTGLTYQPTFLAPGVHLVTLKSGYTCATVQSNAVTVNVTTSTHSSRIILTKNANGTAGYNGCTQPYAKGDTFVLQASQSPYSAVTFICIDSATVINQGGQVILSSFGLNPDGSGGIAGGFTFFNCTHIKLTGTGGDSTYGFKVTSSANRGLGFFVYGRSAWFEIDHLDIYKKNSNWIKQEQDLNNCDPNLGFPNWTLHTFKIHDNWIHNMVAEGMYLGSTAPDGTAGTQHHNVFCKNGISSTDSSAGSVPDDVLPMRLGLFDIYNNIIDSTNRGGIQLSDADSGMSLVHDNHLTRIGFEYSSDQGNGIVTGTYTKAKIYNNYIDSTFAAGIRIFGLSTEIYNNTVLNSGWLNGHSSTVANIELNNPKGNYPAVANDTFNYFNIHDNTVGNKTGANNITGNNQTPQRWSADSKICRSGTINLPVGVPYSTVCDSLKYILIYTTIVAKHDSAGFITVDTSFIRDSVVLSYKDTTKAHFKRGKASVRVFTTIRKDFFLPIDSSFQQPHTFTAIHDSIRVDTSWINPTIIKIGAFYFSNGGVSTTQQIDTLKNYLHVTYMRQNITRGGGGTYHVKEANDSGMHVLLTVNNIYDGAPGWAAYLDSLFSIARPLVVCFRNEPTQNSTSMLAFLADLAIGIAKAHEYGILVADGGTTPDVAYNAYNYWNTHGKQDSASKIRTAFPSLNFLGAAATKANLQYDTLLTAYRTIGLDLANIHAHQPLSDTSVTQVSPWFHILSNYVKERTGLPFMVGEYGTWNHSCQLLEDFSNEIINAGAEYLIYFDGNGNAGQDIKLQDCFKNYVGGL